MKHPTSREEMFSFQFRIIIKEQDFLEYDTSHFQTKRVFSFIDPFGIFGSLGQLKSLLNDIGSFLMLNLNVETMNRWRNKERMTKAFGDKSFLEAFDDKSLETNERLEKLVRIFMQKLGNLDELMHTARFSMRKGRTSPDKALIFYLVYAVKGHNMLHKIKVELNKELPEGIINEIGFSDYYFYQGIEIPFGKKLTEEEEADIYYQKLQGKKNIRLGIVKKLIIEETHLPYRAGPMKILENQGKIRNIKTNGEKRIDQKWCYQVSVTPYNHQTRFGNYWRMDFPTLDELNEEEEAEKENAEATNSGQDENEKGLDRDRESHSWPGRNEVDVNEVSGKIF